MEMDGTFSTLKLDERIKDEPEECTKTKEGEQQDHKQNIEGQEYFLRLKENGNNEKHIIEFIPVGDQVLRMRKALISGKPNLKVLLTRSCPSDPQTDEEFRVETHGSTPSHGRMAKQEEDQGMGGRIEDDREEDQGMGGRIEDDREEDQGIKTQHGATPTMSDLSPSLDLLQSANEDRVSGKRSGKDHGKSEGVLSDRRESAQITLGGLDGDQPKEERAWGTQVTRRGSKGAALLGGGDGKWGREGCSRTGRPPETGGVTREPRGVNGNVGVQDAKCRGSNDEAEVQAVEGGKRESGREREPEDTEASAALRRVLARKLARSSASSPSSSFTSSPSSSFTVSSSAESDDVFSEGDEVASKRKTMKKCRSWRTFRNIMHWSLRRQSSWVQLAGHPGNFQLSGGGEVLKLFSEVEAACLRALMDDPLRPFVPQYHGHITKGDHSYIRLEDLLCGLRNPITMDCKMGLRTYQEEEIAKARSKPAVRTDMYHKMVRVDPTAPSEEEHGQKGVTKWRYLQWKDTTSSTSTLGFRIEGLLMESGGVQRDFRKTLTSAQATAALLSFTRGQPQVLRDYHCRLHALKDTLKESPFFRTHEVIGSSLLFVHDHSNKASVWMIDFGKTTPVPCGKELQHDVCWEEGSREDGYLVGLASLTTAVGQAITQAEENQEGEQDHGGEDSNGECF